MKIFRATSLLPVALVVLFARAAPAGSIVINEIHFDPPEKTALQEFVELVNNSTEAVDLSGWYLAEAVEFTFPAGTTLGPGEYLVVAESPEKLQQSFGDFPVLGPFAGFLSSEGEKVVLRNARGGKEDEVDYRAGFPWPTAPNGEGSSLELIHPDLDNSLGGSWRASLGPSSLPLERRCLIASHDGAWRYRKGLSEASDPAAAWRGLDFVEDSTWNTGTTSIGYGDGDDATVLDDMLGNYSTVYLRREFTLEAGEPLPRWLVLRFYVDDGCIIWINGREVLRTKVTAGEKAYNAVASLNEAKWTEVLLSDTAGYLAAGRNLIAVHAINQAITSDDFSIDLELCVPARGELPAEPTPGRRNSVYSENAPPAIRQVSHGDQNPSGEPIVVTARVTDPDEVASVVLQYQIVLPGKYIPSHLALEPQALMATPAKPLPPNPAFEDPASWIEIAMADDGKGADVGPEDGTYTAVIPPQGNRTLVRYRIRAADAGGMSVTVPYPDDPSLNFALYVYDGVPGYRAAKVSVHPEGKGHVYPPEVLTALPVYSLLTRNEEILRCVAYNGAWQIPKGNEAARDAFNWEGAFVYRDEVFDHVHYRLHQANDRYGGVGKRSFRIRFNKGHLAQLHDNYGRPYPTRWRTLDTGKMFDNKGVGNFGLTETLNSVLWNLVGVPAPFLHTFHFRVVDGVDEAPAEVNEQYHGDFWGMALAFEDYDSHFVQAHGLPDGNLYKLKDGIFDGNQLRRNQGRYAVTTDADFQNIRMKLRPTQSAQWLDDNVRYDKWYPYHTVVEAIRHYDFVNADSHSKNRAWFFEPYDKNRLGRLWTLPHDSDASWGPNWNEGIDYSTAAITGNGQGKSFRIDYRNFIREFRDLVWREEVINTAIDDLAAFIKDFALADRDRWRGAPADAGSQDFGTLEAKVKDMKSFAFVGWSGASGPTVPAGGRAKFLDGLANLEGDLAAIPRTPQIRSTSPDGFPIDSLSFEVSPFDDPQGDDTFGALRWRLAEITPAGAPFDRAAPRLFEWSAVWESGPLAVFESAVKIPMSRARPGHTYRVRARVMDSTGRWSHWSDPVEFRASEPRSSPPQREWLRVTEVMYNPGSSGDAEFIEIQNTGAEELDLSDVRFDLGIEFSFAGSAVTSLPPGGFAVVVNGLEAFRSVHDAEKIRIAGEWTGKLDNGGEAIRLVYGDGLEIQTFSYRDSWYPETDGGGRSLTIADPGAPPESWSTLEAWRASSREDGTPGEEDPGVVPAGGLQRQGDLNQDSRITISDAIVHLGYLFLAFPVTFPCEGGEDGVGNRSLLDVNGDGASTVADVVHLLSYLFTLGPPPALGAACRRIPGCPERCVR